MMMRLTNFFPKYTVKYLLDYIKFTIVTVISKVEVISYES